MSEETTAPRVAPQSPVWVKGIGPPLRQLEEDYRQEQPADEDDWATAGDVLPLIQEVYRLRAALERRLAFIEYVLAAENDIEREGYYAERDAIRIDLAAD